MCLKMIRYSKALCIFSLLVFVWLDSVSAQDRLNKGLVPLVPVVPTQEQRPQPSNLERQNLIQRPVDDQESFANLLQHASTDDALLEVVLGRGRLLTLREPLAQPGDAQTPTIAVGDPSVLDFEILPNSQMIRLLGSRVGVTDLSLVTGNGKAYTFQVHVVYDLNLLRAYLKQIFPNSHIKLSQLREHLIVEGEAASVAQSSQIIQTLQAFLSSAQVTGSSNSSSNTAANDPRQGSPAPSTDGTAPSEGSGNGRSNLPSPAGQSGNKPNTSVAIPPAQIINLLRVPGVQQVMLQVRIAELNRTAFRQIGSSFLYSDTSGRSFGSQIGSSTPLAGTAGNLLGLALGSSSTAFAIIPNATLSAAFDALRQNQVIKILAEPNLMALHGQQASFLAGGEFPIPVPQNIGGGTSTFTIEFREFGVLLDFIPYIMENQAIRLHVAPEVSTIDTSIGVTSAGVSVPGISTRRANTTVELHQGQTLALAGLIQVELEATTDRLPGLGDLPYLGPFFSNTTHEKVEKELVILVTPFLVDPMDCNQVGELPGSQVRDPDDHEFYFLNRIENRHPDVNYRATNGWDDPLNVRELKTNPPQRRSRFARPIQMYGDYGYSLDNSK